MSTFLAGALFGALFAGSAIVVLVTKMKKPKHEIIDWSEKAYEPPVTTRIVNRHRSIEL